MSDWVEMMHWLADEYGATLGDEDKVEQFALVERLEDGSEAWLTTHPTVAEAIAYSCGQEMADRWVPLVVVDLETPMMARAYRTHAVELSDWEMISGPQS